MKLHVDWRALFAAYVRMWGVLLIVPLAVVLGIAAWSTYEHGLQHMWGRSGDIAYLLAFKAAFYAALASIQLAVVAVTNLIELLLRPTWRANKTPIRPMIGPG